MLEAQGGSCSTHTAPHFSTEDYFMPPPKRSLCYCESCRKLRGDEAHRRRGEPPREYALPFGWCRFNLRYTQGRVMRLLSCSFFLDEGGSQEGAWKKPQNLFWSRGGSLSSLPGLHPRVNPRLEAGTMTKKWHMAYHGSNVAAIRRVLDRGELGAGPGAGAEKGQARPGPGGRP